MNFIGFIVKPIHYPGNDLPTANITAPLNLALPENAQTPTKLLKVSLIPLISADIPFYLLTPKIGACFWPFEQTTIVTMPETTVDQDHRTIFWQNNIR
ncbi:MAG: hypothetical protein LPK15_11420 [Alteromonadaceae bacterium]|nr:hypothetical protein [Alteromonadaceae bacterium]